MVSYTVPNPSERPLTRPNIINPPNVIKSFAGDAIPRNLQNASTIDLPSFIITATAFETPERTPKESPFTILLPKVIKSFAGDAIPRRLQNASTIEFPRFIIALTALEAPE